MTSILNLRERARPKTSWLLNLSFPIDKKGLLFPKQDSGGSTVRRCFHHGARNARTGVVAATITIIILFKT